MLLCTQNCHLKSNWTHCAPLRIFRHCDGPALVVCVYNYFLYFAWKTCEKRSWLSRKSQNSVFSVKVKLKMSAAIASLLAIAQKSVGKFIDQRLYVFLLKLNLHPTWVVSWSLQEISRPQVCYSFDPFIFVLFFILATIKFTFEIT